MAIELKADVNAELDSASPVIITSPEDPRVFYAQLGQKLVKVIHGKLYVQETWEGNLCWSEVMHPNGDEPRGLAPTESPFHKR